jgi:uncharacterized membrane protein
MTISLFRGLNYGESVLGVISIGLFPFHTQRNSTERHLKMTTVDEITYLIAGIVVMVLVVRWIMRRGIPAYDNVWLEFAGLIAGLNLVTLNWQNERWFGVVLMVLWTIMKFVHFSQAFDADKANRLTSAEK